ncbi:M1 family metallopeptidase [Solirubrobacter soli]|uniref:M1 family metallopeptidase n=1 Tax=Solirubrobacter soli TaxID=363832 RepID=UPI00041D2BBD|nr:M1 family metallopeptidase [Solirubrobacter soli]
MKHLLRSWTVAIAVTLLLPAAASAAPRPGAAGIGDPYFPKDGNGGYDVAHYGLFIDYTPKTKYLKGVARITAKATQDLSRFNLDLQSLTVRSVSVGGRPAKYHHRRGELAITPRSALRRGRTFVTVVRYEGYPKPVSEGALGGADGWMPTDDGALVAGEPHGASTWYPVNEHPRDKASYSFRISVPRGVEAIANGILVGSETKGTKSIWRWEAKEPMAAYLSTATIGQFEISTRTVDGIPYVDAIDPDLLEHPKPRTGARYAVTGISQPGYQRLMHTIAVPAGGAKLSFHVRRDTQPGGDFFFVEAHTAGADDWTTLRDAGGNTSAATPFDCAAALKANPFLAHYLAAGGRECTPRGTTGIWRAATFPTGTDEEWTVDLSRYAGRTIEISLSYLTDEAFQLGGVAVDDVVVTGAGGSTSFEDDGDTMDGWTVAGAPPGSKPNTADWTSATQDQGPRTAGDVAEAAVAKEPQIIDFLAGIFGPYPFSAAGSIIDDRLISFALENQTRPIYSRVFFEDRADPEADTVIVHELAHQWAGDSLSVHNWRDIWLNEGFATYAEWLWAEQQGRRTAQAEFDEKLRTYTPGSGFWSLKIGDPGRAHLFDPPVYQRGAMTLHALRVRIGDDAFFRLLKQWVRDNAGGTVTTKRFIALAERVSGKQLDGFFDAWLYTKKKPSV